MGRGLPQRAGSLLGVAAAVAGLCAILASPASALTRSPLPDERRLGNEHFLVHYSGAAGEDGARRALGHLAPLPGRLATEFGFAMPPPDGTEGGDSRFDVYIDPAETYPGINHISYFNVRPDTVDHPGTLAHELFHSVQYFTYRQRGYDSWMLESLGYWFGLRIAPTDDQLTVIDSPTQGLFCAGPCTNYGESSRWASFAEYLASRFGLGVVRALYAEQERLDPSRSTENSRAALENVLAARGASLPGVFADYARASLFPRFGLFAAVPVEATPPRAGVQGRLATTARLTVPPAGGEPGRATLRPRTVPAWGVRYVQVSARAGDELTLSVTPAHRRVTFKAYTPRDGRVRTARRRVRRGVALYTLPGARRSPGRRLVHLALANPADGSASLTGKVTARRVR